MSFEDPQTFLKLAPFFDNIEVIMQDLDDKEMYPQLTKGTVKPVKGFNKKFAPVYALIEYNGRKIAVNTPRFSLISGDVLEIKVFGDYYGGYKSFRCSLGIKPKT